MKSPLPPALVLGLLLTACAPATPSPASTVVLTPAVTEPLPTPPPITVDMPILFCEYSPSRDATLTLELVQGDYDAQRRMWDRAWEGQFQFRYHQLEAEDVISCPLNLSFNGPFLLYTDDYTGDGAVDFVLTQFGSASGGDYAAIFTLGADGVVAQLPVQGDPRSISSFGLIGADGEDGSGTFLLPFCHTGGSRLLDRTEDGFTVTYEDVRGGLETVFLLSQEALTAKDYTQAHTVRDVYRWEADHFTLVRQDIFLSDGTLWQSGSVS